ncbi:MAG: tetratricopeptide repeat-containing protein, partial [Ferruginibacter sp.]
KLKLLNIESRNFKWEMQANRYLGESFFKLKLLDDCRIVWEKIKDKIPGDLVANDRLSTVYQRLADIEMDKNNNPVSAEELLAKSDNAIDIILRNYADLDIGKRAETFALKARNAKTRWINEWKNIAEDKKEEAALKSVNLEIAYENYERGYYENLNHYYSGINAMGLLTIIITLAKRYTTLWAVLHDDDDNKWEITKLEDKLKKLVISMQFSLEAEKRRLKQTQISDRWFEITDADFAFLTASDPTRVGIKYSRALTGAENFYIEAAEKQLLLCQKLNILSENVIAALGALPPKFDPWSKVHYLLFTGHMLDKPGRQTARFPESKLAAVKQKIIEKIAEVSQVLDEGTVILGIAGGACGGDILFHETCRELKIKTQLFLAMPREDFLKASVSFAGPDWITRFDKIYTNADIPHFELSSKTELPKWLQKKGNYSIWERNNLWELNSALVNGGMNMTLIALWDGKGGDGPGGTEDMVKQANDRGAKVIKIEMDKV